MKIEVINGIRVGTPTESNNYLYNANARVITDEILLGIQADENEWVEITEEEKQALEKQWEEEDFQEATESDYQNALAEMGVEL